MKAFVTGITGFVGSHLAEHLLAKGGQVCGSSLKGKWRSPAPARLVRQAGLQAWDLASSGGGQITSLLRDFAPDVIFHLGAISVPSDCGAGSPSQRAMDVNVKGVQHVVDMAASLPSRPRVILASSCHVYAPVDPAHPHVDELAPTDPANAYGKTKALAEEVFRQARREGEVQGTIIRCFHHAGPRQDERLMVAEWCRQLVQGQTPVEIRSRNCHVDLSDVRDLCKAFRQAALLEAPGEVYNVGGGRKRRTGDIFDKLCCIHGQPVETIETCGEQRFEPIADTGRIQFETGWRPTIPLWRTLADSLAYWKSESHQGAASNLRRQ